MDADDRLRLDYDQTTQFLRSLTDARFKLLAFVPTVSGAAVGLLGSPRPGAELIGVGLLGLVATLGIFAYELRNTQVYEALIGRTQELERLLGLSSVHGVQGAGGVLGERPGRTGGLLAALAHERGWVMVYSAAIAGWSYLVTWGLLRYLELDAARTTAAAIGLVIGVLVFAGARPIVHEGGQSAETKGSR